MKAFNFGDNTIQCLLKMVEPPIEKTDYGNTMFACLWKIITGIAMAGVAAWFMAGWWAVLLIAGMALFLYYTIAFSTISQIFLGEKIWMCLQELKNSKCDTDPHLEQERGSTGG
jgi:hypothetical protein